MQIIKREDIPEKRQVRLTIAVDRDTWQASLARCYQGVKSVCPVSGEPTRENIEKQYGAEFLYQEAVNDTYPAALVEAIGQSDIQIAGTPTLTVEEIGADGYTFAAVIDLYPEVQLGQYKGLSAVYPEVELSSDDTEAALEEYARANPHVEHPDRAAMGDEVVLDFEGFVDGVAFEGGKGEQYPLLLGSGYFIPGFEEQVAGAAVGEERDVNVTFPAEYMPELAGKDAVFRIKVHQITRRSLPEWNDDFARQQGFADVSALRRAVMEAAVQKKQAQAAEQFANDLIRQVTSAMTVTIPDAMVENQLDGLINELRGHLQAQGVSLEQYLEAGGHHHGAAARPRPPAGHRRRPLRAGHDGDRPAGGHRHHGGGCGRQISGAVPAVRPVRGAAAPAAAAPASAPRPEVWPRHRRWWWTPPSGSKHEKERHSRSFFIPRCPHSPVGRSPRRPG